MFKITFETAHCVSCPFHRYEEITGIIGTDKYFCYLNGEEIEKDEIFNQLQLPAVCPFKDQDGK